MCGRGRGPRPPFSQKSPEAESPGRFDGSLTSPRRHLGLDTLHRSRPHSELCGEIFKMPLSPFARAFLMLSSILVAILGRPRVLPLARARLSPALTRLTIIDRSNWAKTPHIWNMASPAGVEVSRACWWR